jgi:hypothetical protein
LADLGVVELTHVTKEKKRKKKKKKIVRVLAPWGWFGACQGATPLAKMRVTLLFFFSFFFKDLNKFFF